jgi:hypothetical protein
MIVRQPVTVAYVGFSMGWMVWVTGSVSRDGDRVPAILLLLGRGALRATEGRVTWGPGSSPLRVGRTCSPPFRSLTTGHWIGMNETPSLSC